MIIEVPTVTSKITKTHCKNGFHGLQQKFVYKVFIELSNAHLQKNQSRFYLLIEQRYSQNKTMLQTFSDTRHFIVFYILIITQSFLNQIQNDTRRKIKQFHVVKILAINRDLIADSDNYLEKYLRFMKKKNLI